MESKNDIFGRCKSICSNIINKFRINNKKILHIMKNGMKYCGIIGLLALFILKLYCDGANVVAFKVGMSLFKSWMYFMCMFIVCGVVFNRKIKE